MNSRKYSIKELARISEARVSVNPDNSIEFIDRFVIDSRYRGINETSCFVALKSSTNDGHLFLKDAYEKGVRCFLVENHPSLDGFKNAVFLKVSDTLKALQAIGSHRRNEIQYPIIGITGSNGKTVVKEWLYQILNTEKIVYRSPKSFNSQIGVALSLILLPDKADYAIIEAGISQPGEMNVLSKMIRPEIGVLTNIHQAHLENFKDKDELIREKLQLFSHSKKVIYCKDYGVVDSLVEGLDKSKFISWTKEGAKGADYSLSIGNRLDQTVIAISDYSLEVTFPYKDQASIENAIHCMILSKELKLDMEKTLHVVSSFSSVAMRLQQMRGINNCTLINDTYNSDLISLEIALNFMNMQHQHNKKTLILSDIYQSGMEETNLYKMVNQLCLGYGVDRIIGIGEVIDRNSGAFEVNFKGYNSTDDFLNDFSSFSFFEEVILIKGSRKFGFERISNMLENKRHETYSEVNLSAVIDNLNYFRSILKPEVKTMGMVKAFSYGTGSFEIANVLLHHGVNYLAVAYIDEGITLREKGINSPIMVMNPAIGELDQMLKHKLEPEVFNLSDLYIISDFSVKTGKEIGVHLKVETGMNRLGLELNQVDEIADILDKNKGIQLKSVFSHLVGSDNSDLDDFTKKQAKRFITFCDKLEDMGHKGFIKHLLNSDGIQRFEEYQFDMVRLGIGLYGITSIEEMRDNLRSVVSLKSRISQIKEIEKGESVGYSRSFIADRDMKIATVPIGYADGLVRKLGNGNWYFRVGNEKAPIVGNICMDMTMIDISYIEGVREKDIVSIYTGNSDIYKMAEKRGTIPYEILTSISERIKRVYYYGD